MMEGMTIYFDGSQAQLITTSNQSKRSMCNFGPTGLAYQSSNKISKTVQHRKLAQNDGIHILSH